MISQIQTIPEVINVLKILSTGFLAFVLAFLGTPLLTHFLYKKKLGIKIKEKSVDGQELTYVSKLHAHKAGTPTMGGILIWATVGVLVLISHYFFPVIARWTNTNFIARLDFFSRAQVWLPLFAFVSAGILGLIDDYMSVRGYGKNKGGGMRFFSRFGWLIVISILGAWWFHWKLGWDEIHVPAVGDFSIGFWYVPLFIFVILFTAISSNETDGLDGLDGGILLIAFSSFALISFFQNKMDLAAFCAALSGALLAFLWFNVYPAKFIMGDTGAMALGITMGVVAMLTDTALLLPCFGFILMIESLSVIVQKIYKKVRKKKLFLSTPLHHHFEAKNWPETLITMRFWIVQGLDSAIGLAFYFLDKFML